MLRINEIKLPVDHGDEALKKKVKKILGLSKEYDREEFKYEIIKRSVDSRKKPELFYVYSVNVKLSEREEERLLSKGLPGVVRVSEKRLIIPEAVNNNKKLLIVGSGPAGMFAGLILSRAGLSPVIIERGEPVEKRVGDVERFWTDGILTEESNVLFGEGGAGTFSDGKLDTGNKDKYGYIKYVIDTIAALGGGDELRYESKPHVGTDVLRTVVKNIRAEIESLGGRYIFGKKLVDLDIEEDRIKGVFLSDGGRMDCDAIILAIGHSAGDTMEMLRRRGLNMAAKDFAVGFRIEHPQKLVDDHSYGERWSGKLPSASYKLTYRGNRSVYSFCMCPGGYVVNSSAKRGSLCINGMSYRDRNSKNANSAIVAGVGAGDFVQYKDDPVLAGLRFQEEIERAAGALGGGMIIQQLWGDFLNNRVSKGYGSFESMHKGAAVFAELNGILPESINDELKSAIEHFNRIIPGFSREDAILSAVESRTSSPVRILRDDSLESNVKGIFPCGEGAGYAGGITSSAVDGIKAALAVIEH